MTADALDLHSLARRYAGGRSTPAALLAEVRARIVARGEDGVWTSVASAEQLTAAVEALEQRRRAGDALPLYGVPFGVKDNIDVTGFPTTAACPAFAYEPARSAVAVARLVAKGAVVVGKTNMDQFATGLVGTRSPYGVPRNPFDPDRIAGGSSSGSAVAVALGQVSFTLGTDTAGSGRVPAAFNNIVGLKPSCGVVSTVGVVPACRALDCVSVFAATCDDAAEIADLMQGFDPEDAYARDPSGPLGPRAGISFRPAPLEASLRVGVPAPGAREFLGDEAARLAFEAAVGAAEALGVRVVEVDLQPFLDAGKLLYDGPFVAQRLEAAGRLFADHPDAIAEPLRTILRGASTYKALDAYLAEARLRRLRHHVAVGWREIDVLMVPTAPTLPRIDAVAADPVGLNAALGRYATFVNLLDLAALAVPAGSRADGLPAGVTLIGPWGSDGRLAGLGDRLHRATTATVGATALPLPPRRAAEPVATPAASPAAVPVLSLAVAGAHLSGEPLNHQLTSRGATLVRTCRTAPRYRLFALPGTTPPKPGLVRVPAGEARGGAAIEVEVWSLDPAELGTFVAGIPAPLGVGKIELEDGSHVTGFVCESYALEGAEDITSFGGWRAFLRARK